MQETFIYALVCPRTECVRYIGKANDVKHRLAVHVSAARHNAHTMNARWLKSLDDAGLKVSSPVIHRVAGDVRWQTMERFLIASALHFGMRLNNGTKGGDGVDITPEDVSRVRALRRAGVTESVLRQMSKSITQSWASDEIRQRRIEGLKRVSSTPEARERLRATAKKPRSEQAKANRLAAVAAYWAKPESRAKAAEVMRRIGQANSKNKPKNDTEAGGGDGNPLGS